MACVLISVKGKACRIAGYFQRRLGVVGKVEHTMATTRRDARPSGPLIVPPTLSTIYPCAKAGLKRSRSRDRED